MEKKERKELVKKAKQFKTFIENQMVEQKTDNLIFEIISLNYFFNITTNKNSLGWFPKTHIEELKHHGVILTYNSIDESVKVELDDSTLLLFDKTKNVNNMADETIFIKPKTIEEQVKKFKEDVLKEINENDIKRVEVALDKLYDRFKIDMRSKDPNYWLPKRYNAEFKKQGISFQKRRGYKTAYFWVEEE